MAGKSTVVMKKTGNRGGVVPGGGTNVGRLPYGAVVGGGQSAADPVKSVADLQKGQRRAVGYGQH